MSNINDKALAAMFQAPVDYSDTTEPTTEPFRHKKVIKAPQETERQLWIRLRSHPRDSKEYKSLYDTMFQAYWKQCQGTINGYAATRLPKKSIVDREDCAQGAAVRLVQAMEKFNPDRGITFMQYFNASQRSQLLGGIVDETRRLQNFPREIAPAKREINSARHPIRQALQKEPTIEEILDAVGWEHIAKISDPLVHRVVFNQAPSSSDTDEEREESHFSDRGSWRNELEQNDRLRKLSEHIDMILNKIPNNNHRLSLYYYYWLGYTDVDIARFLKCSTSTAMQWRHAGQEYIRIHFRNFYNAYFRRHA